MEKLDKITNDIVGSIERGNKLILSEIEGVFVNNRFEYLLPILRNRVRRRLGGKTKDVQALIEMAPVNDTKDGERVLSVLSSDKNLPKREVPKPELIGGARVSFGGKRFDASIAHQISRLEALLKE